MAPIKKLFNISIKEGTTMLLIFDCDGVLRSYSPTAVYDAYQAIAFHIDRDPRDFWQDFEEFSAWVDFTHWGSNLEKMGIPLGSDYTQIRNVFHEVYDPQIQVFPWVQEILQDLSYDNELAVLTSSIPASVMPSLKPLAGFFSRIITNDHVSRIKPDPEGINLIVRESGYERANVIMIGDADVDILAGKNAGVGTVGVTWGVFTHEQLSAHNPDVIINDPYELIQLGEPD
ncbi:MAG TPA: HAD family hydrolase [Patescibacteria group bacterium]